jgi:pilus assembly protein CpaE
MTRVLVLGGSSELVARVNVLPGTQVVSLTRDAIVSDGFDLLRSLDPQSLPDIVFIGAALPGELALDIAQRTDATYPSTTCRSISSSRRCARASATSCPPT